MTTHSQAPDQGKQPDPCTCGHRVADHVADDWDDRGNPVNPICRVADCDCDWSGLRSPTVNVDVDTSAVRAKLLRTTDSGRSGLDPSVTTTFIVELSPHQLDLSGYAGDFADDYDMDAVRADFISLINCELPDGISLCANEIGRAHV